MMGATETVKVCVAVVFLLFRFVIKKYEKISRATETLRLGAVCSCHLLWLHIKLG